MKPKPIYITTTLPYANSVPHIGHTLEFLQADAYARYFREKFGEENVFFNIGVDEHGLKIVKTAVENGVSPKEYTDKLVLSWKDFCNQFQISFDFFYRTTSVEHHLGVQQIWEACIKNGAIYKKHYDGLYCIGCEAFLTEKDLIAGKCPYHDQEPVEHSEENYFLKLSDVAAEILNYINFNSGFLKPASLEKELINFLKEIQDISISRSRKNLSWGIQVPGDPKQTIYVWFEALTNYIQVVGYGTNPDKFRKFWPGIQLCGPDNLRFQGAIWQGILAILGLPFSHKLLVHGTIFGPDGRKMSKSLANVISPMDQFKKFGLDACRFYLLGVLQTYGNSTYREEDLIAAYNTYLANNYGNLINRVIHLSKMLNVDLDNVSITQPVFMEKVNDHVSRADAFFENFELHSAVQTVNELLSFGNKYIVEQAPWQNTELASEVLCNLYQLLYRATELLEPIIPEGTERAKLVLKNKEKAILFPQIR